MKIFLMVLLTHKLSDITKDGMEKNENEILLVSFFNF